MCLSLLHVLALKLIELEMIMSNAAKEAVAVKAKLLRTRFLWLRRAAQQSP